MIVKIVERDILKIINKLKEYKKAYYQLNKEKCNKSSKKWYLDNLEFKKEYDKEYVFKNKDRRSETHKKWRSENIEKIREYKKIYYHNVTVNNPEMSWDNHGLYNGDFNYGWDIDHILPLSSAKTDEEVIKLNHYTNLQPLCSKVNRDIKSDKTDFYI